MTNVIFAQQVYRLRERASEKREEARQKQQDLVRASNAAKMAQATVDRIESEIAEFYRESTELNAAADQIESLIPEEV